MGQDIKRYLPRMEASVSLLKEFKAQRLLDIGCGDGSLSLLLKEAVGATEIYGIEISPEATEIAKRKGVNAICMDIDYSDFPFDSNFFDAVFCGELIEHLLDPDHLLEEIYRVLKPTGCCIFSTPNVASWHCRLHLLMGYQPYFIPASPRYLSVGQFLHPKRSKEHYVKEKYLLTSVKAERSHIKFFTLRGLTELLRFHNFRIIKVIGVSAKSAFHVRFPLSQLVYLAEKMASKYPPLASQIIIQVAINCPQTSSVLPNRGSSK